MRRHVLTSKAFDIKCIHITSRNGQYDERYASDALKPVLKNPDTTLSDRRCRIIKSDKTTTVGEIEIDDRRCIVKRYNTKNLIHAARRPFQRSRAENCWIQAHALSKIGVAVAPPIGWIQEKHLGLKTRSWLISEFVHGNHCQLILEKHPQSALSVIPLVAEMLVKLWNSDCSHGDLKATNIICTDDGPVLIDLDATCQHWYQFLAQQRIRRDLRRFLHNWQDNPFVQQQAISELRSAMTKVSWNTQRVDKIM